MVTRTKYESTRGEELCNMTWRLKSHDVLGCAESKKQLNLTLLELFTRLNTLSESKG